MHRNAEEITEIERHKYFLSEKEGYDVGWDHAEQDWEANFAAQWREDQNRDSAIEREAVAVEHEREACQSEPVVAVAQAVEISPNDAPAESNVRLDPAVPGATRDSGPLKRLFSKLFAKAT